MRNKSRVIVCLLFAVLTGYLALSDALFLQNSATTSARISPDSIFNRTRPSWGGVEKRVEYEFDLNGKTYAGSGFVKTPFQDSTFPVYYKLNNPSNSRTHFPSPIFWAIGFLLSLFGIVLAWQPGWSRGIVHFLTSPPSKQIDITL